LIAIPRALMLTTSRRGEAADGLEKAQLVLADALARVERGAA
jgi:hypothetical protein